MAAAKGKGKWAGWPDGKPPKNKDTKSDKPKANPTEHLLLSEQVLELFQKLDPKQRRVEVEGKTRTRDGCLSSVERAYLSSLLSESENKKKEGVAKAICCAEFFAELFPADRHVRLSEADVTKRLTSALRRSPYVTTARNDVRLSNFVHKIPEAESESPAAADPFSVAEIFLLIVVVCEQEEVVSVMRDVQAVNLSVLIMAVCKLGNINRKVANDKFALIKEELNIEHAELCPDAVYQLWELYCKFVVKPPKDICMLDVKEIEEKSGVKNDPATSSADSSKGGSKQNSKKIDIKKEPDNDDKSSSDVDNLTEWMSDIKISDRNGSWASFFKRLEKRCKKSKTLKNFIRQAEGGCMTVAIQFRDAYKQFPDFDWLMAFREFPEEQTKLWLALEDLANDPFCGFGKQSGHPHSAYLHLGYLGMCLMEKVGGRTTLSGYMGFQKFKKDMKKKAVIDRWVNAYISSLEYPGYHDEYYYDGGRYSTGYHHHGQTANRAYYEDPTLKYRDFKIREDSAPKHRGSDVPGDPTLKYRNFKIPNGKGTHDQGYYEGTEDYYGYGDGYYENYEGYQGYQGGRGRGRRAVKGRPEAPRYDGGYGGGLYSDSMYGQDSTYGHGDANLEFDPSGPSMDYYRGLRDGYLTAMRGRQLGSGGGGRSHSQQGK